VKEIFFTQKGDKHYAICPRLPDGDLVIRDLKLAAGATIDLVGGGRGLAWTQEDGGVRISLPRLNPSATRYPAAWVFRIAGLQ
jgi:hypothetical protein